MHGSEPSVEHLEPGQPRLFFDAYRSEIREVFNILGVEDQWSDNLDDMVETTQPWARGDHSRPGTQMLLTPEQSDELQPLYENMGMVHERPLHPGHYDVVLNFGAIHRGNNRRLDYLRRAVETGGVTADRIMLLGGQRRPYEEVEKEDIEQNVSEVQASPVAPDWARNFSERPYANRWETDLIRLAAYARLGDVAIKRLHLNLGDSDPVRAYDFSWNNMPVTLTHSRAVERPNGEPRHTTESCLKDWVQDYVPPRAARVAFIGANPHLDRMGRSAHAVLEGMGRGDIELVLGGSAAPEGIKGTIFLGEIARNLYEDRRQAL